MDILQKIVQIGIPVVLVLAVVVVFIAILDRHPRKKLGESEQHPGRSRDHDDDPS